MRLIWVFWSTYCRFSDSSCRYGLNQATTARIRNLRTVLITVIYTSYETMIKFTLLLMVFFSFYEVATFSVPPVDESKLKSWNVERRKGNPDKFSVTRKSSDYHCYHEWCSFYFSARYNRGQCGCDCDSNFPSFIPSMKTCINASQARSFGGMCYNT